MNGKDVIIYSVKSFILQQNIPNAQLILYPDSSHGSTSTYSSSSVTCRCSWMPDAHP